MPRTAIALGLLLLAQASQLTAINTYDVTVVVPVIGRFPGAGGTQWRTDLYIGNRNSVPKTVTLTFYMTGGATMTSSVSVAEYSVTTLRDVVLNRFGQQTAAGQLILSTTSGTGFEARARIYNAGNPAGEFGQNAPGIGLDKLTRQAYLFGLSGINGNRVNSGAANPTNRTLTVAMVVFDGANNVLGRQDLTVPPHQTVQTNDIFAAMGIPPQENVQINYQVVNEEIGDVIYGYASEVRNDTGDAIFIFGTSPNS